MSVWNDGGRHDHLVQRSPRAEYRLYFLLIFILALPFAAVSWLREAVVAGRLPQDGPPSRAWHEASLVTPMIFRP